MADARTWREAWLAILLAAWPAAAQVGPEREFTSTDAASYDRFGSAIAEAGPWLLIGALTAPTQGIYAGAAFLLDSTSLAELTRLAPQDPDDGDAFGVSAALWGDVAIVGAYGDDGPQDSGAVYFFRGSDGTQLLKLKASDAGWDDRFGVSLAVSGDHLVVGAPGDEDLGQSTGSVYVFSLPSGDELYELHAPDTEFGDQFGAPLAAADGKVLVGAYGAEGLAPKTGAAYLYDLTTGTLVQELYARDGKYLDKFGWSVAVAGSVAVVGAPGVAAPGSASGAAYVFDLVSGEEIHKLLPADGRYDDRFGHGVAISGNRVLVAARFGDGLERDTGAVYVYNLATGEELQKLYASDGRPGDLYGQSVHLRGERALIGSELGEVNAPVSGSVYAHLVSQAPGNAYCFGNGSGTPCPCGNEAPGQTGCAHSGGAGARLEASGTEHLSRNDLAFHGSGLVPLQPALLFAGRLAPQQGAGLPFGDGLRCAAGSVRRLGVTSADGDGRSGWEPPLLELRDWEPGDTARFQVWYRDPLPASPCGAGFNTTNGIAIELVD